MKSLFTFLALTVLAYTATSQITISEHEIAFKADANDVPEPNVFFSSDCGVVKVDIKESMASGGCIGNLVRTYTATDDCGNTAKAEQYLSLQDKKGPELLGVPEDIVVNDESEIPEAPVVGAKDLGDKIIKVTLSETKANNQLTRTWSATDKCGNYSESSQVITIKSKKS